MSIYTLSKDLIINIKHKTHYCDLLFVFTQTNPHKISLDKSNRVLDIYNRIAEKNDWVKTWLDLISFDSSSYEKITVEILEDLEDEEVFLKVCAATKATKKLIVFSHQNWTKFNYEEDLNAIKYGGHSIKILDKDEAISELNRTAFAIDNSIVAIDGSTIKNAKNKF